MSELNSEVFTRLNNLERGQARLETKVEGELASREWVRQIVEPIKETTRKIEQTLEIVSRDNQSLTAAHNKLLEERSLREKAEHDAKMKALESQTWSELLKNKWQPLLITLVALSTLIGVLSNWIAHLPR